MTTYELIQKLAQYPPQTKVTIAVDWSDPIIDDSYQEIEGNPTITLKPSGWATEPTSSDQTYAEDDGKDACAEGPRTSALTLVDVEKQLVDRLHQAVAADRLTDAEKWSHVHATLYR